MKLAKILLIFTLFSPGMGSVLGMEAPEDSEKKTCSIQDINNLLSGQDDKSFLSALPRDIRGLIKEYLQENQNGECGICLSQFETEDKVTTIEPCTHKLHTDCYTLFLSHLKKNQTPICPYCRTPMLVTSKQSTAAAAAADSRNNYESDSYSHDDNQAITPQQLILILFIMQEGINQARRKATARIGARHFVLTLANTGIGSCVFLGSLLAARLAFAPTLRAACIPAALAATTTANYLALRTEQQTLDLCQRLANQYSMTHANLATRIAQFMPQHYNRSVIFLMCPLGAAGTAYAIARRAGFSMRSAITAGITVGSIMQTWNYLFNHHSRIPEILDLLQSDQLPRR